MVDTGGGNTTSWGRTQAAPYLPISSLTRARATFWRDIHATELLYRQIGGGNVFDILRAPLLQCGHLRSFGKMPAEFLGAHPVEDIAIDLPPAHQRFQAERDAARGLLVRRCRALDGVQQLEARLDLAGQRPKVTLCATRQILRGGTFQPRFAESLWQIIGQLVQPQPKTAPRRDQQFGRAAQEASEIAQHRLVRLIQ